MFAQVWHRRIAGARRRFSGRSRALALRLCYTVSNFRVMRMSEPDSDGPHPDQFEMRRLESLSNTIFGVAMTLLAYDLPKSGQFDSLPGWRDIYHLYSGRIGGLVLSFVIAGIFWFSHQRRLARQPYASRNVVFLNLLFLLTIILLPVTNGLSGSYGASHAVAVLYGLHLTAIAALNSTLWLLIHRQEKHRPEIVGSFFPLLVFIPGTVVALFSPELAKYIWLLGFGGLFVRRFDRPPPSEAEERVKRVISKP
jgi:uncharacterized membrane protein